MTTAFADFTHAADLIDRGRCATLDWIATGSIDLPSPERFLSPHHHDPRVTDEECPVEGATARQL